MVRILVILDHNVGDVLLNRIGYFSGELAFTEGISNCKDVGKINMLDIGVIEDDFITRKETIFLGLGTIMPIGVT